MAQLYIHLIMGQSSPGQIELATAFTRHVAALALYGLLLGLRFRSLLRGSELPWPPAISITFVNGMVFSIGLADTGGFFSVNLGGSGTPLRGRVGACSINITPACLGNR